MLRVQSKLSHPFRAVKNRTSRPADHAVRCRYFARGRIPQVHEPPAHTEVRASAYAASWSDALATSRPMGTVEHSAL